MFYTIDSIAPISLKLKALGSTLTLATGFFDLIHTEHINFLQKAKKTGDVLIVAVESDTRAHAVKGKGRPIDPQSTRCENVANFADYVVALGDDFDNQQAYENLIASVRPDVYAVSSHTSYLDNKKELVEKYGGQLVVVHDFNPGVSTSKILEARG